MRYESSKKDISGFIVAGAMVLGVGVFALLSFSPVSKKEKVVRVVQEDSADELRGPGYRHMREVETDDIKNAPKAVLGVYAYGKHSHVNSIKNASQQYWYSDISFFIADYDVSRLALEDLVGAKVLSRPVAIADCPVAIFFKNGKEVEREKCPDYAQLCRKLDELFHGGKPAPDRGK